MRNFKEKIQFIIWNPSLLNEGFSTKNLESNFYTNYKENAESIKI